jgi:hypothetical protein
MIIQDERSIFWEVIKSFIHLAVCLTTGPKPLPKRALHIVRSRASSFRCEMGRVARMGEGSFVPAFGGKT